MHSLTLIVVILTFCLSVAVVWVIVGHMLKISMRASMHWAVANATIGAGMAFWIVEGGSIRGTFSGFLSDAMLLGGFCIIRRGVQVFTRGPSTDVEQMLVFINGTVLAYAHHMGMSNTLTVVGFSALSAWTFFRCGIEAYYYMTKEFPVKVAVIPLLPLFFLGAAFTCRVFFDTLLTDQTPGAIAKNNTYNGAFLLGVMISSFTFNVSLSFLVVSRLVLKLKHLSTRDHLTNLFNRRQIQIDLQKLTDELAKVGTPFSLVMIDLDRFKSINDTRGHAVGDLVLKKAAAVFLQTVQKAGIVGRLGGEEFCVILPATNGFQAGYMAERMRVALESEPMTEGNTVFFATASFGVATCHVADEGWSNLMKRADVALYAAKSNGRNRVEMADPTWVREDSADRPLHGTRLREQAS